MPLSTERATIRTPAAVLLFAATAAFGCGASEPRAVVLVGVDTLRADHLGTYGATRPTSPFVDRAAEEGVVFERAFATSPWTLPSFASMFTGRLQSGHAAGIRTEISEEDWDPERVGLHRRIMLDPGTETLAEILASEGFATIAVTQNPNLDPAFGIDRGFDVYDYDRGNHDDKRRADVVVDLALEYVDSREAEDFFLFVHFFDPHLQDGAPPPYGGMFSNGLEGGFRLPVAVDPGPLRRNAGALSPAHRAFIEAAYDEEIRFVDSQFERLVAGLKERGLWDGSLIILTSDHGEELFEHDGFEHGHTLFNEVIRVPLIVWGPGIPPGRETEPVSIADVAPTVLEALGFEVPVDVFGVSLWPHLEAGDELPERLIAAEGTLYGPELQAGVLWPYKIIVNPRENRARLFDLRGDFSETEQVRSAADLAQDLRDLLELQLLASSQGVRYEGIELDPELRRRLRSLGYIR